MRSMVMRMAIFGAWACVSAPLFAQPQVMGDPRFAPPPALPPPGLHDRGVKAAQGAAAAAKASPAAKAKSGATSAATLEPSRMRRATPVISDPAHPRGAPAEPPPDVNVVKESDKTVEQYSRNGQVYMVVVRPRRGPPQTYYVGPNNNTSSTADQRNRNIVAPPMYTLFQWGKAPPPPDEQTPAP